MRYKAGIHSHISACKKGLACRSRRRELKSSNERHNCSRSQRRGERTSFSHTDEQRKRLRRGLRILARLIALAHMRRQSSVHQAGPAGKSKDHAPLMLPPL